MNRIIITDLPKPHDEVKGCWYNGYPIHKGYTENSLNYATVYSHQNHILPDLKRIKNDFKNFKKTLQAAGFEVYTLPFPEELNQVDNLHHDAVFVRDSGLIFKDCWIKARFSATNRQMESEIYAPIIAKTFNKRVVELPGDAYLELGEVFYLQTKQGTFYFGGLSRSNKIGHDFAQSVIQADHYCLLRSQGYHLDTVFSPVLSQANEIIAFIVREDLFSRECLEALKRFNIEIIRIDPIDSSGVEGNLGNYAVNALVGPGVLLNAAEFLTPGVEAKLKSLNIKRYVTPLNDFRNAGGSFHCLTNEIYE